MKYRIYLNENNLNGCFLLYLEDCNLYDPRKQKSINLKTKKIEYRKKINGVLLPHLLF